MYTGYTDGNVEVLAQPGEAWPQKPYGYTFRSNCTHIGI